MNEINLSTENKILESAKKEFTERGFDGARMQRIAGISGINKSLLHYYFRSKENLFKAVFRSVFKNMFPEIIRVFSSEINFKDKIKYFIDEYISILIANPYLPVFLIREIQIRPGLLIDCLKDQGVDTTLFINIIQKEIDKGNIRPVPPEHIVVNILSLCIFPVVASNVIRMMLLKNDKSAMEKFFSERKSIVYDFVINSIYLEKKKQL